MNEAAAKQLAFATQHNLAVTTEKSADDNIEPMGSPVEANLMRKKLQKKLQRAASMEKK